MRRRVHGFSLLSHYSISSPLRALLALTLYALFVTVVIPSAVVAIGGVCRILGLLHSHMEEAGGVSIVCRYTIEKNDSAYWELSIGLPVPLLSAPET